MSFFRPATFKASDFCPALRVKLGPIRPVSAYRTYLIANWLENSRETWSGGLASQGVLSPFYPLVRFILPMAAVGQAQWRALSLLWVLLCAFAGAEAAEATQSSSRADTLTGPWGTLVTRTVYLEAPQSVLDLCKRPDQVPLWVFPGRKSREVGDFLVKQAGVPTELAAAFFEPAVMRDETVGTTVILNPTQLLELSPAARQVVYAELARFPENHFHANPVLIPGSVVDWLERSRLSPRQRELFRRTLWRRGDCAAFSDVSLLINQATSNAEIMAAIAATTRVPTVMVSVQMPPADRAGMLDYWRAGGRNQDAHDFLRNVLDQADLTTFDLIHLLPSLCRDSLYTYPSLADAAGGQLPDCQWTALNFFQARPSPYYLDGRSTFLELAATHTEIAKADHLGDLICFTTADGRIAHSCVRVAGDLVFTKNGRNITAPWLLQREADVAAIYLQGEVNQVRYLRLKSAVN